MKDCVAVVVTKVGGAETNLVEEKKEEKNISRTADIGTVEKQNNSIIHDVINEAEERSLSNIKSKIGDIKETIASLNSTEQIEKVFKGKIRELNATIQSLRVGVEAAPKSEAVVGLPIVTAWPESERVEGEGEEEESEEVIIHQVDDQRDDSEIKESYLLATDSVTPPMTLGETSQKNGNLSEEPPDSEIVGDKLNREILNIAESDQNDHNSGHTSDLKATKEPNIHSESSQRVETTVGPHSEESGADANITMLQSGGEMENSSAPADLETTTKSLFEDAHLWIPKSTTFASETTFPKNSIESKAEFPTFVSTSSTSDTDLTTKTSLSPVSSTSVIQISTSASTASSLTSTLSTTLTNTPSSSKYNISMSTSESPSSTISYHWVQGSCEEGQVECRKGGGCVGKVSQS